MWLINQGKGYYDRFLAPFDSVPAPGMTSPISCEGGGYPIDSALEPFSRTCDSSTATPEGYRPYVRRPLTVGLALSAMLLPEVPVDTHDRPVDRLFVVRGQG